MIKQAFQKNAVKEDLLKSGLSTFYSDFIIGSISIQYPQIKILNIQIQVRKNKLQTIQKTHQLVFNNP